MKRENFLSIFILLISSVFRPKKIWGELLGLENRSFSNNTSSESREFFMIRYFFPFLTLIAFVALGREVVEAMAESGFSKEVLIYAFFRVAYYIVLMLISLFYWRVVCSIHGKKIVKDREQSGSWDLPIMSALTLTWCVLLSFALFGQPHLQILWFLPFVFVAGILGAYNTLVYGLHITPSISRKISLFFAVVNTMLIGIASEIFSIFLL
ncbi:MAG: hypothetical protein Q3998_04255 [Porphyromonas sp.]|nr:hypothetical protein [Porphyromonas sp.]